MGWYDQIMRRGGYGEGNSMLQMKDANEPGTVDNQPPPTAAPPAPMQAQSQSQAGFWRPGPWLGVPFNQSYGGQPAPYGNLHDQIRNTMNMTDGGAGRFGANSAARYGFQGFQQWRPDTNPYRQQIQPYQYQPQGLFARTGGGEMRPTGGGDPRMSASTQPAGIDHTANFKRLMAEDPSGRLASQYRMRNNDTINWWQNSKNGLFGSTDEMNNWINSTSPNSSNVSALSMDEMRYLNKLAGIRSPF